MCFLSFHIIVILSKFSYKSMSKILKTQLVQNILFIHFSYMKIPRILCVAYYKLNGVRHGVGNISTRATTLVQTSSRLDSAVMNYGRSKFRESRRDNFGTPFRESRRDNFRTPFRESREFVPFGCSLQCELQRILQGVRWWLTPESGPW